jgi:predicted  nucleic acid-binding Zn-ribbon protein
MQHEDRGTLVERSILLIVGVSVALLTVVTISKGRSNGLQDVIRLESRLNRVEQRLFTIENNLRSLEQQTRLSSGSSQGSNQGDLARLASEIQELQRRLANDECALAKLDERTLSPEVKAARRRSGASRTDPCRSQVESPISLPEAIVR